MSMLPNSANLEVCQRYAERHNVMVNSEELIGTTEYVTLKTRCLPVPVAAPSKA